jgi:pimeloyl-ACP methyl ester carboxylesterase
VGRKVRAAAALALGLVLALVLSSCTLFGSGDGGSKNAASQPDPSIAAAAPAELRSFYSQQLSWSRCEGDFQCAKVKVPLDYSKPDGDTIELAALKLAAKGGNKKGSLLVNPGGPGGSGYDFVRDAGSTNISQKVRTNYDVVGFDPRGVKRSAPVTCLTDQERDASRAKIYNLDTDAGLAEAFADNKAIAAKCAEKTGPVLAHVDTVSAAKDLDILRGVLNDTKLNYLGYSYGTSIGAAYLDRFPTHVRAMVLDGALDPSLTWDALLEGQSRGFDAAFRSFLADCDRTRCAFRKAVSGDLGAAYDRLAASVGAKPLRTDTSRTVGPGLFSYGVSAALYSRDDWPVLAQGLADAERGHGDLLLALSDAYLERGDQGYTNVSEANVAVNCLDRPWPHDPTPYLALARKVTVDSPRFGPSIALSGLSCATWPVPPAATPHRVTAPGAPPVLVIGTTGDPATPYAWAVALAGQLSSGVLLTHVGDGHTVYRATAPACITGPVDTYLITGRAPAPARW